MSRMLLPNGLFQVNRLQDEMDRLFGSFLNDGSASYPALTIWEEDNQLVLEAELPGLKLEDLEITVKGDELELAGQRELTVGEKTKVYRQERAVGSFKRRLTLPFDVDSAKAEAVLEHGVLRLVLPKAESAKPRKIAVTVK